MARGKKRPTGPNRVLWFKPENAYQNDYLEQVLNRAWEDELEFSGLTYVASLNLLCVVLTPAVSLDSLDDLVEENLTGGVDEDSLDEDSPSSVEDELEESEDNTEDSSPVEGLPEPEIE